MNHTGKKKWRALSVTMALALGFSVIAPVSSLSVYAENSEETTEKAADKDELDAKLLVTTEEDKDHYDPDQHVSINSKDAFTDDEILSFTQMDGNQLNDSMDAVKKETSEEFTVLDGWYLSVSPEKEEKEDHTYNVSLYLNNPDEYKKEDTELYHIDQDQTEKLNFAVAEDRTDPDKPEEYISFQTKSLSSFLFVTKKSTGGGNTTPVKTDSTPQPSVTPETTTPESTEQPSVTPEPSATPELSDHTQLISKNKIHSSRELKNGDFKLKAGPLKAAPVPQADENSHIQSFSSELFYGADKQSNNNYVWNVPLTTDEYKAGHRFIFRLNYTLTQDTAPAYAVSITVPLHILKDKDNHYADKMEWSIPSEQEVNEANSDGVIDDNEIAKDVAFAYRQSGNNYQIYNFRPIDKSNNGYIELAYLTSQNSFAYQDGAQMNPFTATITYNDGKTTETKSAQSIYTSINTTATLASVTKRAPSSRYTTWDDDWGESLKPQTVNDYDYLVWDIRSVVNATQPYDFSLQDVISNVVPAGTDVKVLGYRFSGEPWKKYNDYSRPVQKSSTLRGERWDHILTAVPKTAFSAQSVKVTNKITATVTPVYELYNSSTRSSTADFSWSQPVFIDMDGSFSSYVRGDGASRIGPVFNGTTHRAYTLDFKAGTYSRYDLEAFNGYNSETKKSDLNPSLQTYDGLDFASWGVGYPYRYTAGTAGNSSTYWQNNVTYQLTDDNVFLLNADDALKSNNGSQNRTIENGSINGDKAIQLTNNDFRIDKLEFSFLAKDAVLNDDTKKWRETDATYDNETVTFEGKFNGSNGWTQFATYTPGDNNSLNANAEYATVEGNTITFNADQNLTAYRLTTTNHHYYTELYTVPFYSLKNSEAVMKLLKDKDRMILVNNNDFAVYQGDQAVGTLIGGSERSDADYACVSQRSSSLNKNVISTSNNVKQRYFTISWRVVEEETFQTGTGAKTDLSQQSGIFYDLLPDGAQVNQDSIAVRVGNSPNNPNYGQTKLDPSAYEISTISNFRNSGRTLLIINIKEPGEHYIVTYDTQHSWDSVHDYGSNVYNPVAYETGNDSIFGGKADDGSGLTDDANKTLFNDIVTATGIGTPAGSGSSKFLYADQKYDIKNITSGSTGLSKRVKLESDDRYGITAAARLNNNYSYEVRFMNNFGRETSNLIFYDSLENFSKQGETGSWTWKGTLQSVDLSQLKKAKINPVLYVSTTDTLDIESNRDLNNSAVWTKVEDPDTYDYSNVKAIAVDASKMNDGKDFNLEKGSSLVFHLYMKAPSASTEKPDGSTAGYPSAYNNVYMNYQLPDDSAPTLMHQDYTTVSLRVAGSVTLHKVSETDQKGIKGISFRLYGTSSYGNDVDTTAKTDADGNITFKDLEEGSYTLQETDATDDYLLDSAEHRVVIDHSGNGTIDGGNATKYNPKVITDKPRIHADVQFEKVDSISGQLLTGAQYKLSGTGDYGTSVLMTAESEDDGVVTFPNVEKGTYSLKEVKAPSEKDKKGQGNYVLDSTGYKVIIDENGNYRITSKAKPRYSHTQNLTDDGIQNSKYGDNWGNRNIRGTGRTTSENKAHVLTIPGASQLHIRITWGGFGVGLNYAYAAMWKGKHEDYNASANASSNSAPNIVFCNGKYQLGGGDHTANTNTADVTIDGDSVTFSFYSSYSSRSNEGDGYGYYAVVTADVDEEVDKRGDTYRLKDEPLHSVSFTKKSSYDQSVLAGAEFSLKGVSDAGNSVDKTAISEKDTGMVRFNNLETGTYVLKEEQAPENYEKDNNQYAVHVPNNGEFTIDGLINTDGIYQIYNSRIANKHITVTKIWDDGEEHTEPKDLSITLSTTVPEAVNRHYTIRYHSNEGTFEDGSVTNEVQYNTFNIPDGTRIYKEPSDSEHNEFLGWFDDKDREFSIFKDYPYYSDDPEEQKNAGLRYADMNSIGNGKTIDLYAKYAKTKYAVMLYGIEHDTDDSGNKMGLTFGPATGGNYNDSFIAHTVDDDTKMQFEDQDYPTDSHNVIVDGTTKEPLGKDAAGNDYRCIHYDNWKTIIYWNNYDPHVYDKCVTNNCTHSVELDLSKAPEIFNADYTTQSKGDGFGTLYNSFNQNFNSSWNVDSSSDMNYAGSRIRAILNGSDDQTVLTNAGDDAIGFTPNNSILAVFPDVLKTAIGKKRVEYAHNSSDHETNGVVTDRLWLLSDREIYGDKADTYYEPQFKYKEGEQYERLINKTNLGDSLTEAQKDYLDVYCENNYGNAFMWTRSLEGNDSSYSVIGGSGGGGSLHGLLMAWPSSYYNSTSISPCFSLSRSPQSGKSN